MKRALAGLCLLLCPHARAMDLIVDPFTDRDRSNSSGGDPLGAVWHANANTAVTLAAAEDPLMPAAGAALFCTASATARGMLAFFPPTTLEARQMLVLDFDFRFTSAPVDNSQSFRFGLYNSAGTRQTTDGFSTTRHDDQGYGLFTNVGADGLASRLFVESAGNDILGGGVPGAIRGLGLNGSSYAVGTAARHHAQLRVTRLPDGNVRLEGRIDAGRAATGVVSVASDQIDTFDLLAFSCGGVVESFLVDNVHLAHLTPPLATLTAPVVNTEYAGPVAIEFTATASDPDGSIARVEFYRGPTKIGEDPTAPYSFRWENPGAGVHALSAVAVDNEGVSTASAPVDVRVTGGAADAFDSLRARWRTWITGDTLYRDASPDTRSVATSRVQAITTAAQANWDRLDKSPARTSLYGDAASTTSSAHVSTTASRLRSLALAYATADSALEGDAALLADLTGALRWFVATRYNPAVPEYDNWWDWELGTPYQLNDIAVLLYDRLPPSLLMDLMRAVDHFSPTAEWNSVVQDTTTGANRTDKCMVVAVRAVVAKDATKLVSARDLLSPALTYTTNGGDGFYSDGSFIQHRALPSTGSYGTAVLQSLPAVVYLLAESPWPVTDPNLANLYAWIYDSFDPVLYRGACLDFVRGRSVSRSGSEEHAAGHALISSILNVIAIAPEPHRANFKSMVKGWLTADTARNYLWSDDLLTVLRARPIMSDPTVPVRPEPVRHRQFPRMDRVLHVRPGFTFAVSLSSSRIYNFESINGENLHGWYQGDGATFLYNDELGHYSDGYWATVNNYRLAGITVDTGLRGNSDGSRTTGAYNWAGGAELHGLHGSAGMELDARASTLTARKSWFLFGDEVVALGSGITCTDGRPIETVVENRRLKDAASSLVINGITQPSGLGYAETIPGVATVWLQATGGYVFPAPVTLHVLREARTGAWGDVNTGGSATALTRNYATFFLDHGINPTDGGYAYILLPGKSAAETAAYAAAPAVQILENTPAAHGVHQRTLGITAAHFWEDGEHTVGPVTSDRKAAVLVQETATTLDLGVSDPTQANAGPIALTLARSCTAIRSVDPRITVIRLAPRVILSVDTQSAYGATVHASLQLATPLQLWRQTHFGTMENAGDSADTCDFDADGLPNLLEWATGRDPRSPSTSPISLTDTGTALVLTYERSTAAARAGATFSVEWSADLTSWQTTGITTVLVSDDGVLGRVQAILPTTGAVRSFARLRVTP